MNEVFRLFVNLFERLPICFLGRGWKCRACPPVCFLMVFETAFFKACFGDLFFDTTSTSSGTPCFKSSLSIRFAVGRRKLRANGKTTDPIPAAKAPNPIPLCLKCPEKCGNYVT